ncbi:hypothetical protein ACHAXT_009125 [Thalassiosira profunda]
MSSSSPPRKGRPRSNTEDAAAALVAVKKSSVGGTSTPSSPPPVRKSKDHCKAGCPRYRKIHCEGYCLACFKATFASDKVDAVLAKILCNEEGCPKEKAPKCDGYCIMCYRKHNPSADRCLLTGCDKIQQKKEFTGYCAGHAKFANQLHPELRQQKSIKPQGKGGSKVYAAYWPPEDTKRDGEPEWYPATISSYKVSAQPADKRHFFGPIRYYSVRYDDGDSLSNIPEHFVFSAEDYLLIQRLEEENPGKKNPSWKGVKNVTDKKSKDAWAKHVGWYEATIDGEKETFSLLADAVRTHDASVVRAKGLKTEMEELNLPEEWTGLLRREPSSVKGGKKASCELEGCAKEQQAYSDYCHQHAPLEGQLSVDVSASAAKSTKLLRPHLKNGSKVYAAYWPPEDTKRDTEPDWYPGVVTAHQLSKGIADDRYGYQRFYNIRYDDGDQLKSVPDQFVFTSEDYALQLRLEEENPGKKNPTWRGVRNVTDKRSKDLWAKHCGYYEATIDGKMHTFSLLADALRAYDASVVRGRGMSTRSSELNLPEEWGAVVGPSAQNACVLKGCGKSRQFGSTCCTLHAPLEDQLSRDVSETVAKNTKSLRPHLRTGSKVYAAYWPPEDTKRNTEPTWYPGVVSALKLSKTLADDRYGYGRFYDVKYEDGDFLKNVPDRFVFDADDYLLEMRLEEKKGKKNPSWKGVRNVTDTKSKDLWAKHCGWHEATIDGETHTFSLLADALRAYDASVVRERGVSTRASDLNVPEEWSAVWAKPAKEAKPTQKKAAKVSPPKKKAAKAPPKKKGVPAKHKASSQTTARKMGQKKITATVIKPSQDAKVGLGLGQLPGGAGVLVNSIRPDSLFRGTGLEAGLVLESVNGRRFTTLNQCVSLLRWAEGQLTLVAVKPTRPSPAVANPSPAKTTGLPAAKPASTQPAAAKPNAATQAAAASSKWTLEETVLIICLDDKYADLKAVAKYEKMAEHLSGRNKNQCKGKINQLQAEAASGKGIKAMIGLDDVKTTLAKWSKEEIDTLMKLEAQYEDDEETSKNSKLDRYLPRWKRDQCAFKTLFLRWESRVQEQAEAKKQQKRLREEAAAAKDQAKKAKLEAMVTPSAQKDDKGLDTEFVAMLHDDPHLQSGSIEDLVEDSPPGKSEQ